jgi:hypothetical protein
MVLAFLLLVSIDGKQYGSCTQIENTARRIPNYGCIPGAQIEITLINNYGYTIRRANRLMEYDK